MKQKLTRTALCALLAMALPLCLTACGKSAPAASAPAAAVSTPASAPEPVPEAVPASINTVTGTVTAASMNTIVLCEATGATLEFSTMDATMNCADGLLEGDWVSITYEGTINGTDTAGVQVLEVTDTSEHIDKAVAETTFAPVQQQNMFTTARLHVRDGYGTDAKLLETLPKGAEVVVTGSTQNGWKQIEYKGGTAYVFGEYVSEKAPAATLSDFTGNVTPLEQTVYTTVNLRLHEKPGLDAKVVGHAKAKTSLHQVGTAGEWTAVLYDGATVYCDTEYLTTTPPAGATAIGANGLPEGVNRIATDETMTTTVSLHLRGSCSTDSAIHATVPKGTPLRVTAVLDNHWSEIDYGGSILYCATQYLAK